MAATDFTITLAALLKLEAPGGDVNLCDGGFLDFDAGDGVERYISHDPTFGTVIGFDAPEEGFDDTAPDCALTFAPDAEAEPADWYRDDLADCRLRLWVGELDADGKTVTSATLVADMLVDTLAMDIGLGGQRTLEMGLVSRAEKLFLVNEGNVCSSRFHQTTFPGEKGFDNCRDEAGFVAWGTETPRGGGSGSGFGSWGGPGRRAVASQ